MRRLPWVLLLVAIIAGPLVDGAAADDAVQVEIRLKNGSVIRGELAEGGDMVLATRFGDLTIPLDEIRSIDWGQKEGQLDVVKTMDGTFSGRLGRDRQLLVDTGFGKLKVPVEGVKRLRFRSERGLRDDFELGQLEGWRPIQGSWQVQNGQLVGIGSGNYYQQIHYQEELEGDYTFEVTIEGNGVHCGVVWNARDPANLTVLWIQGGTAYVYGGANWWNVNMASWSLAQAPRYQVKIDNREGISRVTVNGQTLGTVNNSFASGRVGLFAYSGTHRFDDFKITF